jgi:hypothetical protein
MMAKDLALHPNTWDIYLDDANDWVMVEDADEVIQRVAVALKTHRGEWLFDTDAGLPYREEIMVRNPDLPRITGLIRALITSIDGVTSIKQLRLDHDESARKLSVYGTVATEYGPADFGVTL